MVVGLDYRDAALSVHDLLQELKTHPRMRAILEGGERVAWGAKTIPEGGFVALPQQLLGAGAAARRRRRRARERAGAEGDPLRDRVGPARGRGGVAARCEGRRLGCRYDEALRSSFVWRDLRRCGTCGSRSRAGSGAGSALVGLGDGRRRGASRAATAPTERDDEQTILHDRPRGRVPRARREADVRQALVGLPLRATGRATTSRATCGVATRVPRRARPSSGRGCARRRSTRSEPGEDGLVEVEVAPVELRPVRCDHGQGRPADPARGRLGARVHAHVTQVSATACVPAPAPDLRRCLPPP